MKNNVPKNTNICPIAGVTTATVGVTMLMMSKPMPVLASAGNMALRSSCRAATGRSSTCSFSWTIRAMSGALPIHSTAGAETRMMTP
jgi:hypothetical protein